MTFKIRTMMKVSNVNPRVQGADDLAGDFTIKGVVNADTAAMALGVDSASFKKTFWDTDGNPVSRIDLARDSKVEDCNVRISRPTAKKPNTIIDHDEVSLKDVAVKPTNGSMAHITFKIQTVASEKESGKMCGCLKKDVAVEIDDLESFGEFSIDLFENYQAPLDGMEDSG